MKIRHSIKALSIGVAIGFGWAVAPQAEAANIALGAAVSISDPDGTLGNSDGWCCGSLAPAGSITNGSPVADGQQWNIGSTFWTGTNLVINVNLGGLFSVTSAKIQADNNDIYQLSYENASDVWTVLGTFSPHSTWDGSGSVGWGLGTDTLTFAAITAKAFDIQAIDGDNDYAVSQFQATGVSAVPLPAALPMFGAALAGLGGIGLRKARRKTA